MPAGVSSRLCGSTDVSHLLARSTLRLNATMHLWDDGDRFFGRGRFALSLHRQPRPLPPKGPFVDDGSPPFDDSDEEDDDGGGGVGTSIGPLGVLHLAQLVGFS